LIKLSDLLSPPFRKSEKIIHLTQDDYGRILVIDDGDHRVLNFNSLFEQSSMQLSYPYQLVHEYTQYMLLALAFIEPKKITLLGLGGGSLLRTLHHLLPNCNFNVVELRQAVVDVAQQYFSLPDDDRVVISVNDALEEITQIKNASSDIIFSDIYDAHQMVPGQLHMTFLTQCHRALSPQGWLVANLHSLPTDKEVFFEELRSLFPTVILGTIAENIILFAAKTQPQQTNPNLERLGTIEGLLQQRLTHLIPKLRPLELQFK